MKTKKLKVSYVGVSILFLLTSGLMSFAIISDLDRTEVIGGVAGVEKPSGSPVDLAKARIGDRYGYRIHPATQEKKMHTGIDFILAEGELVTATADGVVVDAGSDEYRGSYVVVKHSEVYSTSYSHLKSAVVKIHDKVNKKQLLGYVGSTGKTSSEPHLHYEVLKDGEAVDPLSYLPKSVGTK
jgi:murein DD-endopeptidase MepM/ murein hydrolase activator NlpD